MSDEGLGIGHAEGMALFVKDAVVGDRVRTKAVKVKKNYAFARTEEVLQPSEDRTEPICPVARSCGGCQIQEMRYEAQLRLKEQKVRNNLTRIGGFYIDDNRIINNADMKETGFGEEISDAGIFCPIIGMDSPWKYRNKAQFPIGTGRDGKPIAGFYAGRTHSIIDNYRCDIGIEENRIILETVLDWMERNHVSAYDEETGKGIIRHVMTRAGFATGQLMAVIVAAAERLPEEKQLTEALRTAVNGLETGSGSRRFLLTSIILNTNKEKTNVILGSGSRALFGEDYIEDKIGDLTYRISSKSFYQVNPEQTRVLYETALSYAGLTGKETVWDLYCGTGTISLFLAQRAGKVIGVEVIPDAIKNAENNAQINHIDNCQFIVGKAEDLVDRLEKADVIVVDPPRKGLDRIVVDTILKSAPERIVYVSCDSATLARDLKLFSEGGYQLKKVQPVDMFPHTVHVETVVLLSREKVDGHISIDLDIEKLESKGGSATYPEIKAYVKEKYGLNVSSLYIGQIKDKAGIKERKNYNTGSGNGRVPTCPPEKEEAILDAFQHFNLI